MIATLGQLIRERRMELDLTQEELAERVGDGVRQSEISRLERNRVTLPRRQRMEQLAVALDIPVGVLLARSGWIGAEEIEASTPEDHLADDGPSGREPGAGDRQANGHVPRFETIMPDDATVVVMDDLHRPQPESGAESSAMAPAPGWGDDAGEPRNLFTVHGDRDRRPADSLSEEDSQSIRDTVLRTEALIQQTRERIEDTQMILDQSRRSALRSHPPDPS